MFSKLSFQVKITINIISKLTLYNENFTYIYYKMKNQIKIHDGMFLT